MTQMKWRYQVVWLGTPEDPTYSICEVYFVDGKLDSWTECPTITPMGNDLADLIGTLSRMSQDAKRWKPVAYSSLKIGMTFEENET